MNLKSWKRKLVLGAALMAAGFAAAGGEPDAKETARKLVDRHKDALVLVEVVVKMKMSAGGQSQEREQKMEARGTVITPEGLTVVSNSSIDPSRALERMRVKVDITTADVKIVTADGTEHPAELALTDKDLDLAFIRPKGQVKLPCLELKKAPEPALLDAVVSLTRLGRKAGREPCVAVSEIMSVIRKPRLRYLASGQIFLGCPVFTAGGEVLGLALVHTDEASAMSVLPCEDILDAAKQVGKRKAEDKVPAGEDKPVEDKKDAL